MEINCTLITPETDKYELEVFECNSCGFHIGLDVSYLEQVSSTISLPCPSCGTELTTLEPEDGITNP